MSIFKCKMCGGTLEVRENESVCICDFCGTQQTIATTQDEALQGLFNRANILRMKSEFDKAESLYEKIIQTKPDEAEAYWGLILCRYGIEYVEDPKTFKRIPTCHRTSFDSVIADPDYKAALQYADMAQRAIYEAEAKEIDRLQKEILALSQKEEPYDVFICYKETDESGHRTPDSVIANDIYHQLTQEGFKVFYAAISLENKLGSAYEPCIFAALNSAKVMLVVGTKPEYFNAVWVKNEWSRYLKLMKTDRSRILIPCYRDMDAYELPEEFAHLQAQDMSKIGFINDVVRGIKKVLRKDAPTVQPAAAPVSANAAAAQPLIDRGYMALEDKEWAKADDFFEQALNLDAKNGDAYLGKFLASLKAASLSAFLKERSGQSYIDRAVEKPKKTAFEPDEAALRKLVEKHVVPGYLDADALLATQAPFDDSYLSLAAQIESYISECRRGWAESKTLVRAKQYCKAELNRQIDDFFTTLNRMLADAKKADAEAIAQKKKEYEQHLQAFKTKAAQLAEEAKRKAEQERARKERETEEQYQHAVALANNANTLATCIKAISAFEKVPEYKDSAEQIKTLQERRDRIAAQIAKEKAKKRKKILIAAAAIVIVAITAIVLTVKVFIPLAHYNAAVNLYKDGQYEEAIAAFKTMGGYKNSVGMIKESEYGKAKKLYEDGEYEKAKSVFEALNDYKDSKELIDACKENTYNEAVQLMNGGSPFTAYQLFLRLEDYKDAAVLTERCWEQNRFPEMISLRFWGSVVLKKDGSVVAVGDNDYGQCVVSGWKDIVAISTGDRHTVGLRKDGTVVAVGDNRASQCEVSGWKNIVAISAGDSHTVGLKKDGTVVAVGFNDDGQCDVSSWKNIISISAGKDHTVGLKKDGTVVAVGNNYDGQCNVSEWKDIIAISARYDHTVGLKKDGTVVAVGFNDDGQCNVSSMKNIIAVSAGYSHTVGLRKDGSVVAVGDNSASCCEVSDWEDIIAISAGLADTLGLKKDGTSIYASSVSGLTSGRDIKLP